jgi:hypothetical protein
MRSFLICGFKETALCFFSSRSAEREYCTKPRASRLGSIVVKECTMVDLTEVKEPHESGRLADGSIEVCS